MAAYPRLKRTKAFQAVYRRGRWARGRLLSIGTAPNDSTRTQIGLRTRRGLKGAALRNRLKRQLRAVIRAPGTSIRSGFDIVVVLHPPAPPITTTNLKQEFLVLCKRVGVAP